MASLFLCNESSIVIYPFGGITKYDGYLNTPIIKEFIILLGGPLFQEILYIILLILYKNNLISYINFNIISTIHKNLLYFNLLPIIPLDGSKFVLLLLQKIFPYKLSNTLIVVISFVSIFLLSVFEKRIIFILLSTLLIKSIIEEACQIDIKYNKFLLERYLYNFKFKKGKIVNNINEIKRDRTHNILDGNRVLSEKEYLKMMYNSFK